MQPASVGHLVTDGVRIFYRHAGEEDAPVLLLLHGFPSSSFMFRNLIPLLGKTYMVIAPASRPTGIRLHRSAQGAQLPLETKSQDLYTLEWLQVAQYIPARSPEPLAVPRVFWSHYNYGAPTGLRLALNRPETVTAIITQNGNAYVEGFGPGGGVLGATQEVTGGNTSTARHTRPLIEPETYHLNQALMDRPGNKEIQLGIFYDYRTNVDLYPDFQEFFRSSGVPGPSCVGEE
ncbi:Uu.00g132280.m01.CDS01 [Anthostomella pinea]|uniref:Uu.00g132280.m01.CDS01 n=1 Tax=Anthostomella pinea TaxID=933095 RepID=A0AAI8YIC2_9PEZI|nr:Uu.00g132280.m01.CDS01 [Anthostomella pinea]